MNTPDSQEQQDRTSRREGSDAFYTRQQATYKVDKDGNFVEGNRHAFNSVQRYQQRLQRRADREARKIGQKISDANSANRVQPSQGSPSQGGATETGHQSTQQPEFLPSKDQVPGSTSGSLSGPALSLVYIDAQGNVAFLPAPEGVDPDDEKTHPVLRFNGSAPYWHMPQPC